MFDKQTIEQLNQYLTLLESDIVFKASLDESESSKKVRTFLEEVVALSPRLTLVETKLVRTPSFEIQQPQGDSGVCFAGIPMGHEFSSFILALLQVSGRPPKIEKPLVAAIKSIKQNLNFETYISLTCHNCPDVVQALNIMAVLNPKITHTMIDGSMYQQEVENKKIMAVPAVYLNEEPFANGRITIEEIVEKLGGSENLNDVSDRGVFDVLVVGGGPAGASAAIYAARKGIATGMVVDTFGGQVLDTLGIENMVGTPYTEGPQLMRQVEEHVQQYDVDIMKGQRAKDIQKKEYIEVTLENGQTLKTKSAILSTGARWRNINVPGETELKNKGVAYCPHCDGPLFAGKEVAVIGGGNSGIEAAIDLAGLVKHVYVIEFLPELKADDVLQKKLHTLKNVTVITNAATQEITGTDQVNGLVYQDRSSTTTHTLDVEGVFILIGLVPNTEWLPETIETNNRGEVIVDAQGMTNIPGIFSAGDCTNSAYKQIIISMGSGATASLGAFDYLIRQ